MLTAKGRREGEETERGKEKGMRITGEMKGAGEMVKGRVKGEEREERKDCTKGVRKVQGGVRWGRGVQVREGICFGVRGRGRAKHEAHCFR